MATNSVTIDGVDEKRQQARSSRALLFARLPIDASTAHAGTKVHGDT